MKIGDKIRLLEEVKMRHFTFPNGHIMTITASDDIRGYDLEDADGNKLHETRFVRYESYTEITKQMIDNWMNEHGEDFVDYHESDFNGPIVFGYFLAKYPEKQVEMVKHFNEVFKNPIIGGKFSVQDLQELFQEDDKEDDFYTTLAEYMNVCSEGKKKQFYKALHDIEEENSDI